MNINKNDYVILNGKKYYAMGGVNVGPDDDNNTQPTEDNDYTPYEIDQSFFRSKNNPNGVNYNYSIWGLRNAKKTTNEYNPGQDKPHGHNLFLELKNTRNDGEELSPREEVLRGRKLIYDWLSEQSINNPEIAKKIKDRGIDLQKYIDDTNNKDAFNTTKNTYTEDKYGHRNYLIDFDDINSGKITKLFAEYNPKIFQYDNSKLNNSEKTNIILSGPQVIRALRGLEISNYKSIKNERESNIIKNAYKNIGLKIDDNYEDYRAELPNGDTMHTIWTTDGKRRNIIVTKDGQVHELLYKTAGTYIDENNKEIDGYTGDIIGTAPVGKGHYNYYSKDERGYNVPTAIRGNSKGFISRKVTENACGGKTSRRLYASGGSMEAPMPLGPQEDYNAINAGGSHEMNPQGGVPYGVNQDGSQNMVEEGEVSVGNNIFSDRTAMSPELCQQLGLPEGTSPAQAMQQIEALYEQGQIGDEEFQEIQQIIFEDQEAQKQNGGEQMPVEGISPEMVQGGSMQPEMIQGSPMPQQVQNEGIQPEMVQGYGFGGYR